MWFARESFILDRMKTQPTRMLRDDRIIETIAVLKTRIEDRFPGSGLAESCGELHDIAVGAAQRSRWINRPIYWLRTAGYAAAIGLVGLSIFMLTRIRFAERELTAVDWVPLFEAGLNEAVLLGAAVWFFLSLEKRIKRGRALTAIHELRSIAHIIDMHQLTKDPERFQKTYTASANSPKVHMTPQLMNRYLDYCSEMLSLTGKIAALYVQRFDDPVSMMAVTEVEQLTTGLSRKIWQKIIVAGEVMRDAGQTPRDAGPTPRETIASIQSEPTNTAGDENYASAKAHANAIVTAADPPANH